MERQTMMAWTWCPMLVIEVLITSLAVTDRLMSLEVVLC